MQARVLCSLMAGAGDDQSEPESGKWASVSHIAFTTVLSPGPENKACGTSGGREVQNICKLTLVLERREKKGKRRKRELCRLDPGQIIRAG